MKTADGAEALVGIRDCAEQRSVISRREKCSLKGASTGNEKWRETADREFFQEGIDERFTFEKELGFIGSEAHAFPSRQYHAGNALGVFFRGSQVRSCE